MGRDGLSSQDFASWEASKKNPYNWSLTKKLYHTGVCALYAFTITFMSSIYASGYSEVAEKYNVSSTVSLLGVSLFCLGLAFGPMLASPLSETIGRAMIYRGSMFAAILFLVGAAVSQTLAGILVCRFFAGFFGSPSLSVGGGTLADIFEPKWRILATSTFVLAPNLGPSIGPVVGGFVQEKLGYRWLEWVTVCLAVVTWSTSFGMSETYRPALLKRYTKKTNAEQISALTPQAFGRAIMRWVSNDCTRPLIMLGTEPIVFFFSLYVALSFGILYNFFAAIPFVFRNAHHLDPGKTGLAFLAIAGGCLLSTATTIVFEVKEHQRRRHVNDQPLPPTPENILYPAMLGSFGLPIGLFWFGWTARSGISVASPILALVPFAWGNLCIFSSAVSYLINSYGSLYGASAMGANAFVRYIFAGGFPLFTVQMYSNLSPEWASSLLGFISILLIPIPWLLFFFGSTIRQRSPRAKLVIEQARSRTVASELG